VCEEKGAGWGKLRTGQEWKKGAKDFLDSSDSLDKKPLKKDCWGKSRTALSHTATGEDCRDAIKSVTFAERYDRNLILDRKGQTDDGENKLGPPLKRRSKVSRDVIRLSGKIKHLTLGVQKEGIKAGGRLLGN